MKNFILIVCILSSLMSFSQENVTIIHQSYTTAFSLIKHYPIMVDWWLTKDRLNCNHLARVNSFGPDPLLPQDTNLNKDYTGSGYDRGHMCDDEDNQCQGPEIQKECFYFSNMAPQFHALNAGSWKTLEGNSRKLALLNDSIHIWAGSIGEIKKIGRVSVPAQCWKLLYIKKTGEYHAYIFNNTKDDSGNGSPETTVQYIEQLTGLSFKMK